MSRRVGGNNTLAVALVLFAGASFVTPLLFTMDAPVSSSQDGPLPRQALIRGAYTNTYVVRMHARLRPPAHACVAVAA